MSTGFYASAQTESVADSSKIVNQEKKHFPRKATIYSAVLPGLGQIYNKKAWKVPLIYGGFVALGYLIDYNNDYFITYRQAYSDIIDDDPNTNSFIDLDVDGVWDFDNPSQVSQFTSRLNTAKETSRRNRDLSIVATIAFYAINIIDATVDAHFFNFDISDDITMKWTPGPVYCANQPYMGVHLSMQF